MMIINYQAEYINMFGNLPATFGMEEDDFFWIMQQIEMAVNGERGEITQGEVDERGGVTPPNTIS